MKLLRLLILAAFLFPNYLFGQNDYEIKQKIQESLQEFFNALSYVNDEEEPILPSTIAARFGSGNYFIFNGREKKLEHFIEDYCYFDLQRHVVNHTLTFPEKIVKTSNNNFDNRWSVSAILKREYASGAKMKIANEKLSVIVQWRGMDEPVGLLDITFQGLPRSSNSIVKSPTVTKTSSAFVDSVNIIHNIPINREDGMQISMKLRIYNHKGKKCHVAAYFYDSNGNALQDSNKKYSDTSGNVSTGEDAIPNYDNSHWSSFKLKIPYSELHLPSTGSKTIRYKIIVWDMSSSQAEEMLSTDFYTTSFNYTTTKFEMDGTTRSYTDNAKGLTYLTTAIKEKKTCQHGAITDSIGVIIMNDYGYFYTSGIKNSLAGKIKELNQSKTKIVSVTMTNSGYYCLVYGTNGWYGRVPDGMSTKLNEYNNNRETIYCVSICENGAFAIVTDKHFYASKATDNSNMKKAFEKFGQIKDICITNQGIAIVCKNGVYYRNVPTKVEEKIKQCKSRPDHIRFTDSGTCLITYDSGNGYQYYM